MLQPVKEGFGRYMQRFYAQVQPTTKPLHDFVGRGGARSVVFAPAAMDDKAEEMLALWRRSDLRGDGRFNLPIIIVAVADDAMPTSRAWGVQLSSPTNVVIPSDPKRRVFKVTSTLMDVRAQVAIFAADEPTARSLAAQLLTFIDAFENSAFTVPYRFAGLEVQWPVKLESSETPVSTIATGEGNIQVLAVDLTFKAHVPLYRAPKAGEPNDGLGIPGDADDPAGYPQVVDASGKGEAL